MLEISPINSRDSTHPHTKTMFLGIRFVLFGFDSVSESQYSSEIVNCGGIDVGRYDSSCTHVIVHGRVYDDPVCVAARRDNKTLVTELWVEDCLELGRLVDAARILYKPVKDLNGIPGCELLYICLTGYQREERDDIMRMVGLMGAHFSKPLIATKVTHLICYKFEGEKYELAKRMKKIKLVNHRWSEDCLKAWEVLPVDNYNKSGWELEIMEAEARDSEEETEHAVVTRPVGQRSIVSSIFQSGIPVPKNFEFPIPVGEVSNIHQNPTAIKESSHISEDLLLNNRLLSTPVKEISSDKAPDVYNVSNHGLEFVHQGPAAHALVGKDCATTEAIIAGDASVPYNKTVNINKEDIKSSVMRTAERSPHADLTDEKFGSLSYSRKTPRKSVVSKFPEESSSHLHGSPKVHLESNLVKDDFDFAPSDLGQSKSTPKSGEIQIPGTGAKFGSLSYSRKTPRISTIPLFPEEKSSHLCGPPQEHLEANRATDVSISLSSLEQSKSNIESGDIRIPGLDEKFGSLSSSGKTPRNSTISSSLQEPSGRSCGSPQGHLVANRVEKDSDILPPILQQARKNVNSGESQNPRDNSEMHPRDRQTDSLPQKRKMAVSTTSPILGKMRNNDSEATATESPSGAIRSPESKSDPCPGNICNTLEQVITTTSIANQNAVASKSKSSSFKKKPLKHGRLVSRTKTSTNTGSSDEKVADLFLDAQGSKISDKSIDVSHKIENMGARTTDDKVLVEMLCKEKASKTPLEASLETELTSKPDNMDNVKSSTSFPANEMDEHQKLKDEGSSPNSRIPEVENLQSTAIAGTCMEKNHQASARLNRKMVAKRNFVSRPKLSTASTNEVNNIDKTASPNENALSSGKGKDGGESLEKPISDEKAKTGKDVEVLNEKTISDEQTGKNKDRDELRERTISEAKNEKADSTSKAAAVKKNKVRGVKRLAKKIKRENLTLDEMETSMDAEKENMVIENGGRGVNSDKCRSAKVAVKSKTMPMKSNKMVGGTDVEGLQERKNSTVVNSFELAWFILSGHRLQRKEFQQVIRRLRGRVCRDSHHWSYQATHFIVPDPVRRTEKFFAAAASGRWILKTDYLTASHQAGKFLAEEPFEWYKSGLSEDGAINLEAPRKWRLLRERTGHGAFYGMHIIIYGECIAPTLDTLKRAVKAGDGTILATSPPYTRFLKSGVHFAVVSPAIQRVDPWVQDFVRQEIPCIAADYLVEYVCKPGYSLERHVLYKTHAWAEKSFANLSSLSEEIVEASSSDPDIPCEVCGSRDRGDVMMICGDEDGSVGCGAGTHIDCCDPPLEAVPKEDWFCSKCVGSQSSTKSVKASKKKKRC